MNTQCLEECGNSGDNLGLLFQAHFDNFVGGKFRNKNAAPAPGKKEIRRYTQAEAVEQRKYRKNLIPGYNSPGKLPVEGLGEGVEIPVRKA